MTPEEMLELFELHRDAEAQRDYDTILDTFAEDCYLATAARGTRSEGERQHAPRTSPPSASRPACPAVEIRAALKARATQSAR